MAFALDLHMPAHVDRPVLTAPSPREVSFGRIEGRVGPETHRVVVSVDGREAGAARIRGRRFALRVDLPQRDAVVRVVAEDALGNRATTAVARVFGLPAGDAPLQPRPYEDTRLARKVDALVEGFDGISAVYVQNVRTGAGAAWNARAHFPAASTAKLPIALETLRLLDERPAPGSDLDTLLARMLVQSDNVAANELLSWIGGSETNGAAEVNELLGALGLEDSHLYGGFLLGGARPPIPLTVESEPSFEGKYTSAWDLAQLHTFVHLAADGRGPLPRVDGSLTPADARFLLWILAHSEDHGKLDRYVPRGTPVPHKAGWISDARHDAGIVYAEEGPIVAAVMTFTGGLAGDASDELAGRVAEAAVARFRAAAETGAAAGSDEVDAVR